MFSQRFVIFVLALALLAGCASASVIATYTDPTAFSLVTSGLYSFTNITFESDTCSLCQPLVDSGVSFDGGVNGLNVGTVSGWGSGNVLKRSTGGGSISAALPANIYAFSAYLVTVSAAFPTSVDITFTSGSNYLYSVTVPGTTGGSLFFGVTADAPITNVKFDTTIFSSLTLGIDNVGIGAPITQTAEATTFILIGSGLMFLRLLRRRRPAVAAA